MSRVRVKEEEKRCVVIHASVKGKGKLQGEATRSCFVDNGVPSSER